MTTSSVTSESLTVSGVRRPRSNAKAMASSSLSATKTTPHQEHKIPIPRTTDNFIFYRGLNALSQLTEFENASYDFARQRTVSDLSTLQCVHFWTSSVMAGCHSDPAILHAVLALGAAHRSYTLKHSKESCHSSSSFSHVAYTHYGRAIKHLQTRLTSDDPENYRIILVVCLILLSFDLLEQRYAGALLHLHHGRRILKMLFAPKASNANQDLLYLPPRALSIDDELVSQLCSDGPAVYQLRQQEATIQSD